MNFDSNRERVLYLSTAIILVVGSLLPWRYSGDLIPRWQPGLRLWPELQNNGGMFVIFPLLVLLIASRGRFITGGIEAAIRVLLALIILAVGSWHLIGTLIERGAMSSVIGAPRPGIGVYVVILGGSGLLALELRLLKDTLLNEQ